MRVSRIQGVNQYKDTGQEAVINPNSLPPR